MYHDSHRMDDASLSAFASLDRAKRRTVVLCAFAKHGPMTDRECASAIGAGDDLNAARPRITELLDKGLLVFAGRVRCPVTRKTVRRCKAVWDKQGAKA